MGGAKKKSPGGYAAIVAEGNDNGINSGPENICLVLISEVHIVVLSADQLEPLPKRLK